MPICISAPEGALRLLFLIEDSAHNVYGLQSECILMMKQKFPPGWDEEREKDVLEHYESHTEEEAVAEDEETFSNTKVTLMEIPTELVPKVRELLAKLKVA